MLNLKFILKLIFLSFFLIHSNLSVSFAEQKVSKILVNNNFRILEVIRDYKKNIRSVISLSK